ncbi:MAG TPA: YtxH domain-containing protein [Terriglobales bacterium]|nr:YtxH domain-containing protein [Terriglobales bacterium]
MSESKGLWFLVGLSLGALAGILYAPQSGEQTREMLRSKADESRDRVQQTVSDVREKVSNLRSQVNDARDQAVDIAGRGKQAVTRQIDQFQAAVEAGKQAYRESAGLGKGADKVADRREDEAAQL